MQFIIIINNLLVVKKLTFRYFLTLDIISIDFNKNKSCSIFTLKKSMN